MIVHIKFNGVTAPLAWYLRIPLLTKMFIKLKQKINGKKCQ